MFISLGESRPTLDSRFACGALHGDQMAAASVKTPVRDGVVGVVEMGLGGRRGGCRAISSVARIGFCMSI